MTANLIESTSGAPTLQQRAAERVREDELHEAKREAERSARARDSAVTILTIQVEKYLGVGVDPDAVRYDAGALPSARIEIDGLTFAMFRYPSYSDRETLSVAQPCTRGCGHPVWVEISDYRLASLHRAITEPQTHLHDCLIQYDDDGWPITDRQGNPLPPPTPPEPTPEQRARAAIERVIDATDHLAWCTAAVQERADGRAAEKSAAIRRLMQTMNDETGKPHSASSAEKVVELDPAFAQYRQTEAACEVERIRALGVYEAAKLAARLDAELFIAEERNR